MAFWLRMKIWAVGFSHSNMFLRWLFAFSRRKKIGYSSFEQCALLALKFPRQLQKEILMLKYKVKFDVIGDEWRTDRHRKGCSSCRVSPRVEFLKRFWTKRTHIPRATRFVFSLLKSSTVLWGKGVFFFYWDTCDSPVIRCLCFLVVFYFSSATKWKNCAIVPVAIEPSTPWQLTVIQWGVHMLITHVILMMIDVVIHRQGWVTWRTTRFSLIKLFYQPCFISTCLDRSLGALWRKR